MKRNGKGFAKVAEYIIRPSISTSRVQKSNLIAKKGLDDSGYHWVLYEISTWEVWLRDDYRRLGRHTRTTGLESLTEVRRGRQIWRSAKKADLEIGLDDGYWVSWLAGRFAGVPEIGTRAPS